MRGNMNLSDAVWSSAAFQAQLASVLDTLAKAAVQEITKLVEDGSAALRLHVSRSLQRNEQLERRLRWMERELLERRDRRGRARSVGVQVGDLSGVPKEIEENIPDSGVIKEEGLDYLQGRLKTSDEEVFGVQPDAGESLELGAQSYGEIHGQQCQMRNGQAGEHTAGRLQDTGAEHGTVGSSGLEYVTYETAFVTEPTRTDPEPDGSSNAGGSSLQGLPMQAEHVPYPDTEENYEMKTIFSSDEELYSIAGPHNCPFCVEPTVATLEHLRRRHLNFAIHLLEDGTEKFIIPCFCDKVEDYYRSHWHCHRCNVSRARKHRFTDHLLKHGYTIQNAKVCTEWNHTKRKRVGDITVGQEDLSPVEGFWGRDAPALDTNMGTLQSTWPQHGTFSPGEDRTLSSSVLILTS